MINIRREISFGLREINLLPKQITETLKDFFNTLVVLKVSFCKKHKIVSKKKMGKSRPRPSCRDRIPKCLLTSFMDQEAEELHVGIFKCADYSD